jgi:hypothetical protein
VLFEGVITLSDSRLLDVLFNTTLPGQFTQDQQKAISGFRQFNEIVFLSRDPGTSALRLDPTQVFRTAVPAAVRYNPTTNPTGARATVYDHSPGGEYRSFILDNRHLLERA